MPQKKRRRGIADAIDRMMGKARGAADRGRAGLLRRMMDRASPRDTAMPSGKPMPWQRPDFDSNEVPASSPRARIGAVMRKPLLTHLPRVIDDDSHAASVMAMRARERERPGTLGPFLSRRR